MRSRMLVVGLLITLALSSVGFANEPIKIGIIAPLTGGAASSGIHIRYGAEMAADEINAAGGINGRQIKLFIVDDAGIPAQSVSAMNKLVYQDKVDMVVGGNLSSTVLAHMSITENAGIPYIVTSASNPYITRPENKWLFRLHQNDDIQSIHLAEMVVNNLKKTKIAVIHDTNDFGTASKDAFVAALKDLGIEPLIIESYNFGDKDFMPQLIRIRETNPEILGLFGNQSEAAIITNQMRQLGLNDVRIVSTGGFPVPKYIELAPGTSEGSICVSTFNPSLKLPEAQKFVADYVERFKTEPPHHAWNTYEAIIYVLKPILEKVGTDKAAIRDELRTVKWTALGMDKYFDEVGQVIMPSLFIEVRDGKWQAFDVPEA